MIIQGRKTQSIDSIRKRISSMQPIIIYLKVINKNNTHMPVVTEVIEITGMKHHEYSHQKIISI
jgi:hypothetical protein